MKRVLSTILCVCVIFSVAQAGVPKIRRAKIVRVQTVLNKRPVHAAPVERRPLRTTRSIPPVLTQHTPSTSAQLPDVPQITSHPARVLTQNRSWLNQKVRDFQAWQLKRQRAQLNRTYAAQQKLELAKASLPSLLPHKAVTIADQTLLGMLPDTRPIDIPLLSALMDRKLVREAVTLDGEQAPALPFLKEPHIAYRGMALTPADIRHILTNGMERHRTVASNRYNISISGGSHGAIRYFATHPIINLTSSPIHAQYWGSKFLGPKPILTIFKIRGNFSKADIINADRNIAANEIEEVIALLKIDGKPTWCRMQLHDKNTLVITPYTRYTNGK